MSNPLEEVQDLTVVVGVSEPADGSAICERLIVAGVESFTVAPTVEAVINACQELKPDAVILGFTLRNSASLPAIKAIRSGEGGVNKFLPIVLAKSMATAKLVKASVDAGAHEFLALPSSPERVAEILHRAVFVGRPFIEEASYTGPCRRRRQAEDYGCDDRRKNRWPGYVHAAHKEETILD